MTAVVSLNPGDRFPLIVGDMLVSTTHRESLLKRVPTTKDTSELFPADAVRVPCGLNQKIALIGDRLAVGWAGSVQDAKDHLTYLYHLSDLNQDDLDFWLDSLRRDDPGFVGHYFTGSETISFGKRCNGRVDPKLGQIGFLGTGWEALDHGLRQLTISPPIATMQATDEQQQHAYNVLGSATSLVGTLLSMEIANGASLQDAFGGGYEIAYMVNGAFCKLDDVTLAFWRARFNDDGQVQFTRSPLQMCSYRYTGDLLTIRSLTYLNRDDGQFFIHWYDYVDPIYRLVTEEERKQAKFPRLNSKWLCNYILIEGLPLPHVVTITECKTDTTKHSVRFEPSSKDGKDIVRLHVDGAFQEQVRRLVKDAAALYRD